MQWIDADSAERYLRESGRLQPGEQIQASVLAGGISNVVLRCHSNVRPAFVLKQSRPQLRTKDPWFCSPDRIWREIATLRLCTKLLKRSTIHSETCSITATVPELLFEDPSNFAFAMSAAPEPNATWKSALLQGNCSTTIADHCGSLLGSLHAETWHDPAVKQGFDDRQFFDALRLDPYYRFAAHADHEFRGPLQALIESVWNQRHSLVHGDFSPKNLLTFDDGCMLIDFEVGHYGDPAFDLGFFLTHLVLKAIHRQPNAHAYLELADRFWERYESIVRPRFEALPDASASWDHLQARSLQNLAGCLLARIAGKSKIDYPVTANTVRMIVRSLFREQPADWTNARRFIVQALQTLS